VALAIVPIAASAETVNPIFAALERHRAAWDAVLATADPADEVLAWQEGRTVSEADEAANDAENAAKEALMNTTPLTLAGVKAAIAHFVAWDEGCIPETSGEYMSTLLRSPVFSNV
jgi:hypothetical protein